MTLALSILAALLAIFTAVPWLRFEQWWIRVFDFPRLQVAVLAAVVLASLLLLGSPGSAWMIGSGLATLALAGQLMHILPYTRCWPKEALDARGGHPVLRLLIANVQMDNRDAAALLSFIESEQSHLVVLDEPDAWWEQHLRRIEADYPHTMKHPRDTTYGMLLYSRLPLKNAQCCNLVDDEIPSFHADVEVEGQRISLHLLHPAPPNPRYADDTVERDAELLIIGRRAKNDPSPLIVAGDFNDVAWSHTTRLFQRVSGLLDPRRGRGMFNSYHARRWWARWPLDHLFHSRHFRVVRMRLGPYVGSDHFPVLVELEFDPAAIDQSHPPTREPGDAAESASKIERGANGD